MLNNNNICPLQAKFLNLCKLYIYTRQNEREYETQEVDLEYTWSVEYLINSDDKKQPVQKGVDYRKFTIHDFYDLK